MARPPKPFTVLKSEGKSHRTKSEMKMREEGEKKLLTGQKLREHQDVKENEVAHKEFLRIKKLLEKIDKNDALYETVINRYCMMLAECSYFEQKREELYKLTFDLKEEYKIATENMNEDERAGLLIEFTRQIAKLQTTMINIDKQIQSKRKMLLDIEKENIMTIAASLRSVPRQETKEENPLIELLKNG